MSATSFIPTDIVNYLRTRAQIGDEVAVGLCAENGLVEPKPAVGDVVWWWDEALIFLTDPNGGEPGWWSTRDGGQWVDPKEDELAPLVLQGRLLPSADPEVIRSAREMFDAVGWCLGEYVLCERVQNPRTEAYFLRPVYMEDAEGGTTVQSPDALVELYRQSKPARIETAEPVEF